MTGRARRQQRKRARVALWSEATTPYVQGLRWKKHPHWHPRTLFPWRHVRRMDACNGMSLEMQGRIINAPPTRMPWATLHGKARRRARSKARKAAL